VNKLAIWILTGGFLFAQQPQGDAARGKAIFEGKGDCLSCHRIGANGSRSGPDLTDTGILRRATPEYLKRALLDPDADVARANRGVRATLKKDGAVVTGRLLNQDSFTVQLVDSQGNLKSFLKSELSHVTIVTKGLMPSYKGKLSAQEIDDIVSYLTSLKGFGSYVYRK
jgi:putative heme-binding domain-containing protein